ncbi:MULTISPECIES: hypothetical protein [Aliivibrio]|jgi:predicted signal transduction protein with EAL and GGDEF domain|uniref:NADH dehydrogenase n=3 Tax=Aliivibrio TaxID=511678 RepID=A0A1B9NVV7_ALILO|nr:MULTISPECIES: hypothetical protein [Aliivibrio]AZL86030.1 hypothetical protein EIJ81_16925 [Aliivibrio salmonicida]MBB1313254.1 hypothetical protein [Aliivibrio sp. SR45-2]OCH18712.1 hypothetical protein A6E04_02480 [Aliivibrio logei]OEF13382.1 hypothetical protein A1Q5_08290 [Aliivibrio logei 5S-186]CAQ80651.1 putative membrane protein [Aliivibrio salmonicida LFI1238]
MTRFLAISPQSQCYLFSTAFALNLLAMVLTEMWLPMVVGALVTLGLSVEAWVRVRYILPMKTEMRDLQHQMDILQREIRDINSRTD